MYEDGTFQFRLERKLCFFFFPFSNFRAQATVAPANKQSSKPSSWKSSWAELGCVPSSTHPTFFQRCSNTMASPSEPDSSLLKVNLLRHKVAEEFSFLSQLCSVNLTPESKPSKVLRKSSWACSWCECRYCVRS